MHSAHYWSKDLRYFSGARRGFVDALPANNRARLLEIGCGNGDTAAYAKETGKCGYCVGIELCEDPAREAEKRLDRVLIGDVEQLSLPFRAQEFDVLIMSEVIEHLRSPWDMLRTLYPFLAPGCIVISGSPNVGHYSVLLMLLQGRWDYTATGIMDATHLRWFTPATYRAMFEECGFEVTDLRPWPPLRLKAHVANLFTLGRIRHLFHGQIVLFARKPLQAE